MTITRKEFDEGWVQPSFFAAIQALINGKPGEAFTASELSREVKTGMSVPALSAELDEMCKRGHFEANDVLANGEVTRYYCSTQLSRHRIRAR